MRIAADTNVLVRATADDDPRQSPLARAELERAEVIAVALPTLCELARVLSKGYKIPGGEIAEAIRRLIDGATVVTNRPAVEAGLAMPGVGGDFADGVIAYEGHWPGGDVFVSFDRKAVAPIEAQGMTARVPA